MDFALSTETGFLQSLLLAFVGGLFTSFTPCVYPLIPVTLAIFGATSEVSRVKAFCLSFIYVMGIAVTYTCLGMFSALSGTLFGQTLGDFWIVTAICFFIVLMSLYTLDLLRLNVIHKVQTKASHIGGKGFLGAFLMGAVSGLVAAPCAAPALITILGIAASTQNPLWGGALLFSYALGFGLIFLILGTFSSLVKKLPKSGNWLFFVKFLIATALLMLAFFLLQPFLNPLVEQLLQLKFLILILIVAAALLLLVRLLKLQSLKFFSALLFAFSLFYILVPSGSSSSELTWISSLEEAQASAKSQNKILMIDFYADWCAACKEYEAVTFPDPSVARTLQDFVLARIDLTSPSAENDKIQEDFKLVGLPSILFFDLAGAEIKNKRLEGFLNPEQFNKHLNEVKALAIPPKAP